MDLSTYSYKPRESGCSRTPIVAEEGASVSSEGCTAPAFSSNQLHAAVVELVALDNADINIRRYKTGMPR